MLKYQNYSTANLKEVSNDVRSGGSFFIPKIYNTQSGAGKSTGITFRFSIKASFDNGGNGNPRMNAHQTFRLIIHKSSFNKEFVNKELRVSFYNYELVRDKLNNILDKDQEGSLSLRIPDFLLSSALEKNLITAENSFNLLMLLGSLSTSIVQLAIGSSLENLWLAVEGLQQLYYLQYTQLQYVKNFQRYCDFFDKFALKKGFLIEGGHVDTSDYDFKYNYFFPAPLGFRNSKNGKNTAGTFYLLNNEPFLMLYIFSLITYGGILLVIWSIKRCCL